MRSYIDQGATMNAVNKIEFTLREQVDGVEVTPHTIGLSRFNEYNQQVEAFIAGSQKGKLTETRVEVGEGSYKLTVMLSAAVAVALEPDLALLDREDVLGELDPKRAEIVAKWQARAKADPTVRFEIKPDRPDLPTVRLLHNTDFRIGAVVPWVKVEKNLFGTILDMGGVQKANIHLKLKDTGQTIIINAAQSYLQALHENRLYRQALVHVSAQQHYRTGALRNVQLIAIEDYVSVYDEAALDRFAERGREAWRDVPDAVAWVRERRGDY
jgi:hypothetical protein